MRGRTRQETVLRGVLAAVVFVLVAVLGYELAGGTGDDPEPRAAGAGSAPRATPTALPARDAPAGRPPADDDPAAPSRGSASGRVPAPAAAVLEYYALRAGGQRERSAALVAPTAVGRPDAAATDGDSLVAAHGGDPQVRGSGDRATVTFRPWMLVRARTGCAQYPTVTFEVVRAGGAWRIARFPDLPERSGPCDCADSPWPQVPARGDAGRPPATRPGQAVALRELRTRTDFYAEAAPTGWPVSATRPPLEVDPSGAVRWDGLRDGARDIGFPLRARDVNVHVLLRRPTELACVAFALERRTAAGRLSVTVTPDRTDQHVTVFLPYRDGFHWSREPLRQSDGITLHVNGLRAGAPLPALRFRLYAPASAAG